MPATKPPLVRPGQLWTDSAGTVRVIKPGDDSADVVVVSMADQSGSQYPLCAVGRKCRVFYDARGLRGYTLVADSTGGG